MIERDDRKTGMGGLDLVRATANNAVRGITFSDT